MIKMIATLLLIVPVAMAAWGFVLTFQVIRDRYKRGRDGDD